MRIAFQHLGSDYWTAGNIFLEGMMLALRSLGLTCPTLILVAGQQTPEKDFRPLLDCVDEVVRAEIQVPDQGSLMQQSLRYHLRWWLRARLLKRPAPGVANPLTAELPRHNIDAYFSVVWTDVPVTSVATVVWIPDFQHRHLPDNYPPAEQQARDRAFSAQARSATRLLLTSQGVQTDLESLVPGQGRKTRLIDFVAVVPDRVYDEDPQVGLARYHLPEKFFYLPNQFWKHKNHNLVFEALERLQARNVRPCVVSTGSPFDFRDPGYFAEIMQSISSLNLRDQFLYLGQVPRVDVFRLMRQSVCVLNSSRFEGLGLSAAESKSLGKRILVSDLAALREQKVPCATYFNPNDAAELADKLEAIWKTTRPGPDRELEAAARRDLPGRRAEFGRALYTLFEESHADFASRLTASAGLAFVADNGKAR